MKGRLLALLLVFTLLLGFVPVSADTPAPPVVPTTTLNATLHDISKNHPDFERTGYTSGLMTGLVEETLGVDRLPVYAADQPDNTTIDSAASFASWFKDASDGDQKISSTLASPYPLVLTDPENDGVYTYKTTDHFPAADQFFPLDTFTDPGQYTNGYLGWEGNASHNYHFTLELHSSFTYVPNTSVAPKFTFEGDDDVWVFINGKLVIDLGGVHTARTATIELTEAKAEELGLEPYEDYDFDLFFAERHTTQSNFRIDTSLKLNNLFDLEFGKNVYGSPEEYAIPIEVDDAYYTADDQPSGFTFKLYKVSSTMPTASVPAPMSTDGLEYVGQASTTGGTVTFEDLEWRHLYWLTEVPDPDYQSSIGEGIYLWLTEDGEFLWYTDGGWYPWYLEVDNYFMPTPGLKVTKTVSPTSGLTTTTYGYSIQLENTGNIPLLVRLQDTMEYAANGPDFNDPDDEWIIAPKSTIAPITYPMTFPGAGTYSNIVTATGIYVTGEEENVFSSTQYADDFPNIPDKQILLKFLYKFPHDVIIATASAIVTVSSPVPTPPTPPPSPPTTNSTLTIAKEGEGTLLPDVGTTTHTTGTLVQMQAPVPAAGWVFAGWVGANGTEVSNNAILMTGSKSIVARFTPETIITPPSEVPQAAPVIVPSATPTPPAANVETIETPVEVPQAAPALPKTAGVPISLIVVLGGLITTQGLMLRRMRRKP